METTQLSQDNKTDNAKILERKYATGKRKKSIARVWIKKGSGNIYINGKKMIDYFRTPNLQMIVSRPLSLVKKQNDFDIKCSVKGGGLSGQAGAIIHGISNYKLFYESFSKVFYLFFSLF